MSAMNRPQEIMARKLHTARGDECEYVKALLGEPRPREFCIKCAYWFYEWSKRVARQADFDRCPAHRVSGNAISARGDLPGGLTSLSDARLSTNDSVI